LTVSFRLDSFAPSQPYHSHSKKRCDFTHHSLDKRISDDFAISTVMISEISGCCEDGNWVLSHFRDSSEAFGKLNMRQVYTPSETIPPARDGSQGDDMQEGPRSEVTQSPSDQYEWQRTHLQAVAFAQSKCEQHTSRPKATVDSLH
jgi:hypothetical protein